MQNETTWCFHKNKFFFLLKENKSLCSHLLAQHSTLLTIYTHPFVISHFANKNKHDIMYKYTYNKITNQWLWVYLLDYSKKTRQFAIILHFSEFSSWFLKDNSEKILLQELVEFYNKSLNSRRRFLLSRVAMRDFSKHCLCIVDSLLLPGQ